MVRLVEMIYTEEEMEELRKENKKLRDDLLTYIRKEEEYIEKI